MPAPGLNKRAVALPPKLHLVAPGLPKSRAGALVLLAAPAVGSGLASLVSRGTVTGLDSGTICWCSASKDPVLGTRTIESWTDGGSPFRGVHAFAEGLVNRMTVDAASLIRELVLESRATDDCSGKCGVRTAEPGLESRRTTFGVGPGLATRTTDDASPVGDALRGAHGLAT